MSLFHAHRYARTTSTYTPPRSGEHPIEVSGGFLAERIALGFTTVVKTCVCGDERITIATGDARLPAEKS